MNEKSRVSVIREVPGRWWVVCCGPKGILCLTPDDADAQLYQWASVSDRANGILRWPEDVTPVEVEPEGVLF